MQHYSDVGNSPGWISFLLTNTPVVKNTLKFLLYVFRVLQAMLINVEGKSKNAVSKSLSMISSKNHVEYQEKWL